MLGKTQSFDMNGQNYEGIQQKVENILQKDLNYSINTTRLGNSLLRINYFNDKLDKEKQKENRITILQEPKRRIYIQVKGKLRDEQVAKIWIKLEKDLHLTTQVKEKKVTLPTKEDVIYQIIELIKLKGYTIEYNDAQDFLENFHLKYGRLPKNEEITSIVKGYVIMINEDHFSGQAEAYIQTEPISASISTIIEGNEYINPSDSYNSSVVVLENPIERKKCPSCGNEGLIHEVDDKNIILMDYPRIYSKKNCCTKCGYEWRK